MYFLNKRVIIIGADLKPKKIAVGAVEQATRRLATFGSLFQNFLLWCIPKRIAVTRRNHLEYSRTKIMKYKF